MSKRGRGKPADPVQLALKRAQREAEARKPENWGLHDGALSLTVNADVTVTASTRLKTMRVRRLDVFSNMHAQGSLSQEAEQAVRWLQGQAAIVHKSEGQRDGVAPPNEPISCVPLRWLKASDEMAHVRENIGPLSWRILETLAINPMVTVGKVEWRVEVKRITGEENIMAQGALVRAAANNLVEVKYLPRKPRRAVA